MKTKYFKVLESLDNVTLKLIIDAYKNGEPIAFPTETVYGLGVDAFNEKAVNLIYKVKGRPKDNPLILHIGRLSQLQEIVETIPEKGKILIKAFWPGPLTLVLNKKKNLFPKNIGMDGTIGVRMPDQLITEAIFSQGNLVIAAPSANLSGRPSPTIARHVLEDLNGKIWGVIDGGICKEGIESTIVSLVDIEPILLRPGSITQKMIEEVIGPIKIDDSLLSDYKVGVALAPGMKYKHYAPEGKSYIMKTRESNKIILKTIEKENVKKEKIALLIFENNKSHYQINVGHFFILGKENKLKEVIHNFYRVLRECDKLGIELLFIESSKEEGLGFSYMNRLKKAAKYNYLNKED